MAKNKKTKSKRFETRALPSLLEQRNNLLNEMSDIVEGAAKETRALDDKEASRFDEIKKEIAAIDKTIAAEEEARCLEQKKPIKKDSDEEKRALEETNFLKYVRGEERALDVANNGAVIPTSVADRIVEKVKELSPIYSLATVFNIGGDLVFPVYNDEGDTGAALVEDMQELEDSAGKFTAIKLENYIVGVLKVISKSLVNRNDFDLLTFIVNKVAENIAEFLEKGLLNGADKKYQGVFNTDNLVTAASATAITADDLIDLQMEIPTIYQKNACWIMHKKTFKAIRKLKDNEGNYLLSRDISREFGWSLLGNRVEISDNAPEIAAGKTAIVYGDMSGLYVKVAQNMEIQILQEKYATKHALGVIGYTEFDSKIVEKQKIAGLQMKGSGSSAS